ncbi:hypothetical protein BJV78DRAFT_649020 [Lactifluus subvellereus]|nr:hypothetical protein BJV78DRAFT_649020 [Lactifluus subvellereus]
MSDHAQALMPSTKVHAVFGYTLSRLCWPALRAPSRGASSPRRILPQTAWRMIDRTTRSQTVLEQSLQLHPRGARSDIAAISSGSGWPAVHVRDRRRTAIRHEGGMDHVTIMFSLTYYFPRIFRTVAGT